MFEKVKGTKIVPHNSPQCPTVGGNNLLRLCVIGSQYAQNRPPYVKMRQLYMYVPVLNILTKVKLPRVTTVDVRNVRFDILC